jgi:succinate dehydrogenase/fumarate reductase flavoprotein subunit
VTFYSGVPDPRSPAGGKALYIENPASIWLNANGRRFMNEAADDKTVAATAGLLDPTTFWMIFDSRGSKRLNVRDALVANRAAIRSEILSNEAITAQADDIATLARMTGLPAHGLRTSLEAWNRMVDIGTDFQFGRFSPDDNSAEARKIKEPPFYALQVYPLTRKNLGGPAIDINARVVDSSDMPIAGLYAAGELTGVAGINGSHGGAGTFLGPSVLTGRIAGRQAALGAQADGAARMYRQPDSEAAASERIAPAFGLPGYWHYDHVHRLVAEQEYTCDRCHTSSATMQTAVATSDMLTRLNTCTACH